jgi:hypothetical protein
MSCTEKCKAYRILAEEPKGKRPMGKPRRRWNDNINMDLGLMGCGGIDRMEWTRDEE